MDDTTDLGTLNAGLTQARWASAARESATLTD
jgi:hypothetical protein